MSPHQLSSSKLNQQSVTQRESDLWVATGKYLRGEIGVEKLEEIELPYDSAFKAATVGLAKYQLRWVFIILSIIGTLISIVICVIALLITHNPYTLAIMAIPVVLLLPTASSYLFPKDQRRFQLETMRIQRKLERGSMEIQLGRSKSSLPNSRITSEDENDISLKKQIIAIAISLWKRFNNTSYIIRVVISFFTLFIITILFNVLLNVFYELANPLYIISGIIASSLVLYEFIAKRVDHK